MSRPNLRLKPRISYYEPEEPNLDEYIFCDQCTDYVYEYCAIHGPLLVIPDDKVPPKPNFPAFVPRAALTIPHVFLHLAPSVIPGAGIGVFSTLTLPRGVRFGPYRGQPTQTLDSMYCWQIYDHNNKRSHYVDAVDGNRSNWMRYVNCARHWREQNLLAYQYKGQLYYRTIKIIPRFTELMVFYGSEFANLLHVNLRNYNSPAGYAQKYGAPVTKKPKLDKPKEYVEHTIPVKHKKIILAETKVSNITQNKTFKSAVKSEKPNISYPLPKPLINNVSKIQHVNKTTDNANEYTDQLNNKNNSRGHFKVDIISNVPQNVKEKPYKGDIRVRMKKNIRVYAGEKPYKCDICLRSFSTKNNLNIHIRIHTGEKPYKCHICQYSCSQKGNLERHIRTHTGEKPYKCDICQYSFSHKFSLKSHTRIHTGEKPYKCDICQYSFSHKFSLKSHTRIHTGEKPYNCDICQYSCSRKDNLEKHIRIHTGEKPYKCDMCQYSCSQKVSLKSHIRTHTGEKPYKCDICQYYCSHKVSLKSHIRTHTGEKPYKCDICQYSCSQKVSLKSHIRTHTGEKPYKCDICQYSCRQKGDLEKHIRIHTGEKPYKCDICQYSCSDKSALGKHIRIHTGEKPYKCDICQYYCSHKVSLKSHIRLHTGEKPYKCDI